MVSAPPSSPLSKPVAAPTGLPWAPSPSTFMCHLQPVLYKGLYYQVLTSKFFRSRKTVLRHCLRCNSYLPADILCPGGSDHNDGHDEGSSTYLVNQDTSDDMIAAPSSLVPTVGRAPEVRFCKVGTSFDVARLAWLPADLNGLLPSSLRISELGRPPVGFLYGENQVDVLLIYVLDDTSFLQEVK
jgi:hypothetical protein